MHRNDASPAAVLVAIWSKGTPLGLPMEGHVLHRGFHAVHDRLPACLRDALTFVEGADGIECPTLPGLLSEAEASGLVRRAGIGPISGVVQMTDASAEALLHAVGVDRTMGRDLGRALFDACCAGVLRYGTSTDPQGDDA